MTIKTKIITITLFGILIIVAAYINRGEWAVGGEWGLIPVVGLVISWLPDRERRKR